jgi:hypothetical protein
LAVLVVTELVVVVVVVVAVKDGVLADEDVK